MMMMTIMTMVYTKLVRFSHNECKWGIHTSSVYIRAARNVKGKISVSNLLPPLAFQHSLP